MIASRPQCLAPEKWLHRRPSRSRCPSCSRGKAVATWTWRACEGVRSAETPIQLVRRRSSVKRPEIATVHRSTITTLVDHKSLFALELIWNRAWTTDWVDRQGLRSLDSA